MKKNCNFSKYTIASQKLETTKVAWRNGINRQFAHLYWFKKKNNSLRNGFAQCYMTIKDQLLRKENKESLGFFFFKIEYSRLINCLGGMCQTCQGIIVYGMFGI
jgi:hypothetical protein